MRVEVRWHPLVTWSPLCLNRIFDREVMPVERLQYAALMIQELQQTNSYRQSTKGEVPLQTFGLRGGGGRAAAAAAFRAAFVRSICFVMMRFFMFHSHKNMRKNSEICF